MGRWTGGSLVRARVSGRHRQLCALRTVRIHVRAPSSRAAAHPTQLFSRPPEAVVLDPANTAVLREHLLCAAAEAPLSAPDYAQFGDDHDKVALVLLSGAC